MCIERVKPLEPGKLFRGQARFQFKHPREVPVTEFHPLYADFNRQVGFRPQSNSHREDGGLMTVQPYG